VITGCLAYSYLIISREISIKISIKINNFNNEVEEGLILPGLTALDPLLSNIIEYYRLSAN